MRHIVVTGVRQIGKSTLVNRYLEELAVPYAGYRTCCIFMTNVGPIYAMEDIQTGEREVISAYVNGKIQGIPSTFDEFGAGVIQRAMSSDAAVLLFDEIGRFEHSSHKFLLALDAAFASGKQVIAVLKKEELPHLIKIRKREDILFLDLDSISRQEAWMYLTKEGGV